MNLKTFKTDLTYFCKKAQKDGKVLSVDLDNLSIDADGKFLLEGTQVHPLEYFVLGKGSVPTLDIVNRYRQGYNMFLADFISRETEIPVSELYAFMTALENFEGDVKNEYYILGVYIREKFAPIGASPSLVKNVSFKDTTSKVVSNKYYYVNTKARVGIYQVELFEEIAFGLFSGETKLVVQSPDFLKGEVLMSWIVTDSAEECRIRAEQSIRDGFATGLRKKNIMYTEEDVQASINQLNVIML